VKWVYVGGLQPDVEPDDDVDNGDDGANDGSEDDGLAKNRSAYVGRGNVQAVRAARKRAGLSDAFAASDPLLVEFSDFMKASGCVQKDITNKVKLYNTQCNIFIQVTV